MHRGSLMEDAFRSLAHLGPVLKARLSVTFVNEQGLRCGAVRSLFLPSVEASSATKAAVFVSVHLLLCAGACSAQNQSGLLALPLGSCDTECWP